MMLDEIALAAAAATRVTRMSSGFAALSTRRDRCQQAHRGGETKALVDRQVIEGHETCDEGP